MMPHFQNKLRGIIPPLVTPLRADGTLDRAAVERLVAHVLAGGVHGLFILGTTGEGPSLPYGLRRKFVSQVCAIVGQRVPVLVDITDTIFDESIALSKYATDCGATAVVVAPIGEEVVRRCLDLRNCRGLKDSSGDFHYFKRMQRIVAPSGVHSIFIGPEELLAESLFSGGDGGVSGGANVWPELYTRIFALTEAGDWPGAQAAQARVMELSRKVYSIGGYGSTVTKALKMALDLQGICGPAMALPHLGWDEAARVTLRRELSALGLSGTRPELQECPAK